MKTKPPDELKLPRARTKDVTKAQVIKALIEEPLRPDHWFSFDGVSKDAMTCPVCAVGAVLRNACGVRPVDAGRFIIPFEDTGCPWRASTNVSNGEYPKDVPIDSTFPRAASESTLYEFADDVPYMNRLSVVFETMWELAERKAAGPERRYIEDAVRWELTAYVREEFPNKINIKLGIRERY